MESSKLIKSRSTSQSLKLTPKHHAGQGRQSWVSWLVILMMLAFTSGIRLRLLAVPLERDEGEYAYAGQLILQGIPPYAQVYNMKYPGIYAAYAVLLAIFGQRIEGIRLGMIFVNAAAVILVFFLAKRLLGKLSALAAAVGFAILSQVAYLQGLFGNAEHFVILAVMGGLLLLLRSEKNDGKLSLLAGSFLLGVAFVIKQHGGIFAIFGFLYLVIRELGRRPLSAKRIFQKGFLFILGAMLPFAIICLVFWRAGIFDKFWFWTFQYSRAYLTHRTWEMGWLLLSKHVGLIIKSAIFPWILAGVGLLGLLLNKRLSGQRWFIVGFLIFSFLSICPGLYFRPHYFILLLPATALLIGICIRTLYEIILSQRKPIIAGLAVSILIVGMAAYTAYQQRDFFFKLSPAMVSRMTYGINPFLESVEIARYIKNNTSENDRIAVVGSEPQIYFYSYRRSATGYIYTYPLMELHDLAPKMQEEMIGEIEAAKPKYMVFVNTRASWLIKEQSKDRIFSWFAKYQKENYTLVAVVQIVSLDETRYNWDVSSGEDSMPKRNCLNVYRRKNI